MDLLTDVEFLNRLSPFLERFSKTGSAWKCRCPFCGDSQTNRLKTRLYVLQQTDGLYFYCHNCSESGSLLKLIKRVEPSLSGEYVLRSFTDKGKKPNDFKYVEKEVLRLPVLMNNEIQLPRIDDLPNSHPAIQYLQKRLIPRKFYSELHHTDNFKEFCDGLVPEHGKTVYEMPSIIIPIRNRQGVLVAVQGNDYLGKSKQKYNTIRIMEEKLVYGIDRLDLSKQVYVVEGVYDSMFLPNTIANLGSAIFKADIKDAIYIPDNEPRNSEIVGIVKKTIDKGFRTVIWSETILQKDINAMVQAGISPSQLLEIINENVYSGLRATIEFNKWKKV